MNSLKMYFQFIFIIFIGSCSIQAMKVSFFGNGYISMPLQEAKMSTNIRVKFRTHQRNTFLFMATGRTDYCLMRLEDGVINFIYKIEHNKVQLRSPKQQQLNDLEWHDVAIQRYEDNITLQVDGTIIRKSLATEMLALNIHFGAYLGGTGEYTPDFLNDLPNFRGCISDVFYNNINIIKRAKEGTGHTESKRVAWICSAEFEATSNDSISFLKTDSYALMSKDGYPSGETLSFYIRTMEESGMIFYNGGYDFLLLELEKQLLKFHFNKDGSVIKLSSSDPISDGKWHHVILHYNSIMSELVVDDIIYRGRHDNDTRNTIDLESSVYFGGMPEDMQRRLWHKGLRINDISFMGCIRNIRYNNRELGFPQMNESHHLDVKCLWRYPCKEFDPCLKSGYCNQYGIDEFICYCDQSYCIKADFQGPYKLFTETSPTIELLSISPIQLMEGGTVFLTNNILNVLLDTRKATVNSELNVMFHVVQQPRYGQLLQFSTEKNNYVTCRSFSLIDLATDKVKYVHNGQEAFSDHATLDMQVYGDIQKIPQNILGKHRFMLHANITPINDPPHLKISNHKILRVVEGIEKILSTELFNIEDPDSSPNVLIYTILPISNEQEAYGKFMINGQSTMMFSQSEVNMGKVSFLYNTTTTDGFSYDLEIQVSDGIETSDTVLLSVSIHPLKLRLVNNTGLMMIHKSSALITSSNLSISTNTADESIDVHYEIVKAPQYGSIQRLRHVDATWINVDWFSDSQLQLGQIRYIHNLDFPWQDEFKFIASHGFVTTQTFDFRISFTKLKIEARQPSIIPINGSREFILTNEVLLYETVPTPTFPRNIIYKITSPTKYGNIYVEGSKKFAKEMDSFTQLDIDKNRIRYRTHRSSYSKFIDYLDFVVSVAECDDVMGRMKVIFTPLETLTQSLSYQKPDVLQVEEGKRTLLTTHHFNIRFNSYQNSYFLETVKPKFGSICQYDDAAPTTAIHIHEFTLEQLLKKQIYYCHDDSESTEDSFDLLILSGAENDMQYVAHLELEIHLINDNAPYRSVDRTFHVLRGGIKTLNENILQYLDTDMNTNSSDIVYMHISCMIGAFYKLGHYVDSFTQDDIAKRKIAFQHSGADVGTASFIVTDHQHEANGFLEIQASEPFVNVLPSNATIVQEGKFVVLHNKDLTLVTNLDVKSDEIYYEVLKAPSYGIVMYLGKSINGQINVTTNTNLNTNANAFSPTNNGYKNANLSSLANFTHYDVEGDRLVYWNTEVASMDKMRYRVHIKNITAEGEVIYRIYPSAYWEPLQIKRNQTLYVEESTSVLISRDVLEVVHPNISPGDITYLVTSSPLHGYLEMQSMSFDDEYNCKVFDQSAINTEKMFYIQAGVNQSTDYFIFDVTNGITWLRNRMLRIVIIPEKLYIRTKLVSVVEGKTAQITAADIQPYSEYYRGRILEYMVHSNPKTGFVIAANSKVKRFTQKQLEQGAIQYVHDGSETSTDTITMIAMARSKESVPFQLVFVVLPVNDEQPMLITNTGMQVWNGGRHIIRYTDLMAQDYDTPPENLTFLVNYIYGGHLTTKRNPHIKIHNFTQADINNEEIYFMHESNAKRNEISFYVTDGLFNTTDQLLSIVIRPIEIFVEHNENLHVFPLTKKQILQEHLWFRCSDEDRPIRYNVTVPPNLGRLINEYSHTGIANEITEFTQEDIVNGRIFYEHTAIIIEFRINDSFYFDVSAGINDRLLDQKFNIEISVSSGGLLRFLPVTKLQVDEGGNVPIKLDFTKILEYLKTRAGISNPELYVEIAEQPKHGTIALGHQLEVIQKFRPSDFVTKKVYYKHDHSDTLEDTVLMSVYLEQGNIFLCNLTIPVSVNPINDQPFTLVTHLPQMTVVEGENRTITRNILLTEDNDTSAEDIIYDVLSGPTLGVLKRLSKDGVAQDLLVYSNQFTQSDIDNNRIIYVHFGIPQSTTFCFTVTDGKFNPAYEVFTINIAPISILPDEKQLPIELQQGSTTAILKMEHIGLITNVQSERLAYNVTNSPLNGIIVYKHKPTLKFNQYMLETGQVNYMQTNLNRSNDTFQVNAYVPGTNYVATVNIITQVEPVIKITDISMVGIVQREKVRLMSLLVAENALSLKLNKFNPKFLIIKPPSTGQIRKIIRSTGLAADNQNERVTNTFSYKELRSGVVYFIPNKAVANIIEDGDNFEYQLHIKTVQPAQATVNIIYRLFAEDADSVNLASSELHLNYVILICILLILLTIVLVVLLILKFRYLRRHKNSMAKGQPPPLPCPPDLTSVSPRNHHHSSQQHSQHITRGHCQHYADSEVDSSPATGNSTPLPGFSNIPHCKITPVDSLKHDYLGNYDPNEEDENDDHCDPAQQMMLPSRYNPYQLEADTWSSSCDMGNDFAGYTALSQKSGTQTASATPPSAPASNPLLRRNQYWV